MEELQPMLDRIGSSAMRISRIVVRFIVISCAARMVRHRHLFIRREGRQSDRSDAVRFVTEPRQAGKAVASIAARDGPSGCVATSPPQPRQNPARKACSDRASTRTPVLEVIGITVASPSWSRKANLLQAQRRDGIDVSGAARGNP
jgi:hypothetical protein